MIRSSNQELGEYDLIRQPDHIAKVWSVIDASLPQYWDRFVESVVPPNPAARLATKFKTSSKKVPGEDGRVLAHLFEKSVHDYEKEAQKYRCFFDLEAFDEYHDDPNAFKQALSRDVPIIANTLRNRRTELKDWQRSFRTARAKDLLAVFESVLDFIGEWREAHPIDQYIQQAFESDPSGFGLDPLDDDETMFIASVIGMGIKSIVLFHLDPERLPPRGRYGLTAYALRRDGGAGSLRVLRAFARPEPAFTPGGWTASGRPDDGLGVGRGRVTIVGARGHRREWPPVRWVRWS